MATMWEALDALYESQDTLGRMQRHGAGIRRTLLNNIERCERKLAVYQAAIQQAVPGAVLLGDRIVTGEAIGACAFSKAGVPEAMPLYLRPAQAERLYKEKHP